jgi:hypothetical protein
MNASSEFPQTVASEISGRRNLWVAMAVGTVIIAVVVLLAMRLTQALGVKNVANKVPIPTVPLPRDTTCPSASRAMPDASRRFTSRPATM